MSRFHRWLPAGVESVWLSCRLMVAFSLLSATAYGQTRGKTQMVVPGAPAAEFAIQPSSTGSFSVEVPPGKVAILSIEEQDQTAFVVWSDPAGKTHTQRTERDGRLASIRFTLPGRVDGDHHFDVTTTSKKRTARVLVTVSPLHDETSRDQTSMAAEESLAEGDFLWAKHDARNAPKALAAYDRAIAGSRQAEDFVMLRRSLVWKAIYLAFTTGDAQAALPLVAEATEIPDADDIAEQASAWKSLGFMQSTLASYGDGWQAYAKALTLFQKTGDRFNQEVLLDNRGKLSRLTGDYAGALEDANAAAAIARELDDQVGVLHIEDDIGTIHLVRGEMQPAFEAYQDVLGLDSINAADPMIGFAETDLANLYHQLGGDTQAQDMLARAAEFWKRHPYLIGELATLDQEGKLAIDSGDLVKASSTYQRGLNLSQSAKTKREEAFFLLGTGRIARDRKQYALAAEYFGRAAQLAASLNEFDMMVEVQTSQGDLALDQGEPQDAEAHYRQALAIAGKSFDHAGTITALGGLARTAWTLGRDTEARQHIEQALAGIESTRDVIQEGSLRTAYFSSRHSYYDLAIQVLMDLNKQHPGTGYDEEALNTAERARAHSLLEQIEQGGADLTTNSDPALVASRSKTLRDLHLAEASAAALHAGEKDSAKASLLQKRVAELLEEEDRIDAAIDRTNRERALSGLWDVPQTSLAREPQHLVAALQHRLDATTGVLEYWTGTRASYLWVVTATSLQSFTLPSSDAMNVLAVRLRAELLRPFAETPASAQAFAASLNQAENQFEATGMRLGRIILPAYALPDGLHTLLVVGDGPLLSVPIEALRIPNSGSTGSAYLQQKYSVMREPSIQVLLDLWQRRAQSAPMKIALIADPVFGANDPRFIKQASMSGRANAEDTPAIPIAVESRADWTNLTGSAQLRRLSFAGSEATEIATLAGPKRSYVASGFSANVEHVQSMDWNDYTIAHFATHALLNSSHPDLAGIVLSSVNASGTPQPGILWLSDIYDLHMPVGMVVLSACQTSNGKSLPGEGLVGVSHAFFVAGARRVVGSLWDVDDAATKTLMREFYSAILEGSSSPAEALRQAQIKMSKDSRWKNPYYWAGFTIEGDSRALSR